MNSPFEDFFQGLRVSMCFVVSVVLLAFGVQALQAQSTFTWDGGGADSNLSTAENWIGDVAPAVSGDSLTFSTGTTISVVNDFESLSILNLESRTAGSTVTLSGNAISVDSTIFAGSSTALFINADIVLSSSTGTFQSLPTSSVSVSGEISGSALFSKSSGGTVTLSGANSYSGGTRVNNGTLKPSGSGTLGNTSGALTFQAGFSGTLDLNGTSQSVGQLANFNYSNELNNSGIVLNNASGTTATLTIGNGDATGATFYGVIVDHSSGTGTVALTKTGTGTQTLAGTHTYTGDTTVSGGTLLIDGSLAAGSDVVVASGGTIGGSGTIGGATTIQSGGWLSPGNSPGTLTFGDDLTLASGSTSLFEINGIGRGTTFDAVDVGGLTTFGGTLSLTFGSTIADDSVLNLFNSTGGYLENFSAITATGSYAGSFTSVGSGWTLTSGAQLLTFSSTTGDLSFTAASVVPEPSTWSTLAGAAVLGFVGMRRRPRRAVG